MSAAWTCREDIILRQSIEQRMTLTRILARLAGRSARAVKNRARRLGLAVPA